MEQRLIIRFFREKIILPTSIKMYMATLLWQEVYFLILIVTGHFRKSIRCYMVIIWQNIKCLVILTYTKSRNFLIRTRQELLSCPTDSYKLKFLHALKLLRMRITFSPQKWQKSTDGLLKYAEKSAKYIHQDTMKKIGTSKDFSQILAMSTCSSDYTDARTVILAVMKPYSPEK